MLDIRDEQGHPIKIVDNFGSPYSGECFDEDGFPVLVTGVATTIRPHGHTTIESELQNKRTHDALPRKRKRTRHQPAHTTLGLATHSQTNFASTPVNYAKHGTGAATIAPVAGVGRAATGAVAGGGAPGSHTQAHGVADGVKQMDVSASSSSSLSEDRWTRREEEEERAYAEDKRETSCLEQLNYLFILSGV